MLHKTLEAKATTTDLGEFTAIAAAYSVDRQNERIIKGAFAATIKDWQESGKQIPLHWDHSAAAEDIIGTVDPSSMREVDDGLEVKGQLDLDESTVAKDAWRLMKKNAVALSFGFLVREDAKAKDGVREIKDIDLYEITITPAPANPDTRFVSLKSTPPSPSDPPKWADPDAIFISPEAVIEGDELKGAQSGDLKTLWTSAYIADLPDEAFLHERRFPYRDTEGKVDVSHLKAWLAHIPHAELSQDVKEELVSEAKQLLVRVEDARGEEPETAKPEAQDPLIKGHDRLAYELATDGIEAQPPRKVEEPEAPKEQLSLVEERARSFRLMLETMIGSEHP